MLTALKLAIRYIYHLKKNSFVTYSDSLLALQLISGDRIDNLFVYDILKTFTELTVNRKSIVFCWISSHVRISENERPTQWQRQQ